MKRTFVAVITSLMCMVTFAQKLNEDKVPALVKAAFNEQYAGIKAKWKKEKQGYEASFKKDGNDMSVIINNNGTIIETETDISIAALPAPISAYIKEHYKNEKIKEAAKIVDGKGEVTYEAEVKNKDLIFDQNGKFLTKIVHGKKDKEDND